MKAKSTLKALILRVWLMVRLRLTLVVPGAA
jgi:hypothetical protein